MSELNPEEMAALHAIGMLDESELKTLWHEAEHSEEVRAQLESYAETAALLAYDAPPVAPPADLKRELLRRLPARRRSPKIISFSEWVPYAFAACLMCVAIAQANEIFTLNRQVGAEHSNVVALKERNDLTELKLASLEAKDAAYVSAKVLVAWDPRSHNGVVSIENLPPAPAGHDYQLWVLDPSAQGPISAGLLHSQTGAQAFAVRPVGSTGPGFAISLEPTGGRPAPTGAILFAVAPGA